MFCQMSIFHTHRMVYLGFPTKCPAIAYRDRTVMTDEETDTISMRGGPMRIPSTGGCTGPGVRVARPCWKMMTRIILPHLLQFPAIYAMFQWMRQDSKTMQEAPILLLLIIIRINYYVLRYPSADADIHSTPNMMRTVHLPVCVILKLQQDKTQFLHIQPLLMIPSKIISIFLSATPFRRGKMLEICSNMQKDMECSRHGSGLFDYRPPDIPENTPSP